MKNYIHVFKPKTTRIWKQCHIQIIYSYVLIVVLFVTVLFYYKLSSVENDHVNISDVYSIYSEKNFKFNKLSPLIFIGGFPRSGTTLMRSMLDAHYHIRCGQETRVIPRILAFKNKFYGLEKDRLNAAGIFESVMDSAISSFILDIMVHHGDPAPRLCAKDPYILASARYVGKLFKNAKFLFMVRDGRASIHSVVVRNVTISGFNITRLDECLTKWNKTVAVMYKECQALGEERCMMVYYEQLVLHPTRWMRDILDFLDEPWDENVLHHEQLINKKGGVPISILEMSSDQIIKPVNVKALYKWVGFYPENIVSNMANIAPMLQKLGYDPEANPPKYGIPDSNVLENTKLIKDQEEFWKEKAKQLHLKHRSVN